MTQPVLQGQDPTVEVEDTVMMENAQSVFHEAATAASITLGNIFRHPDAHPIVLDLILIRKYGVDWMDWEPETLTLVIERDFKSSLSEVNLSKIHATKTLHMVDTFWQRWEVFNWCTMCFNSLMPNFEVLQIPTVAQCMAAADTAQRIRQDVPYTEEVKQWLAATFFHDQIAYALEPLDFVHLDVENFHIDLENIKERWPEVRKTGRVPTAQSAEDIQLERLKTVHDYLSAYRARLTAQINLVSHALRVLLQFQG